MKASEMVKKALSYVGTKEGKNNWNIFAEELDKVNYFDPQKKQCVDYCSVFLDDMAYKFIKNVKKTHKWLYQPSYNDLSAGAKFQQKYFQNSHRYYKQPKVGDWAFLGYPARHVCMVVSVGLKTVTTVDGNHAGKVAQVVRDRSEFHGFGRPEYDPEGKEGYVMIEMKVIGKGDECVEVLTAQSLLKCKGFKGADGKVLKLDSKFGNNTEYAVKEYQKSVGIGQDGKVGAKTWPSLLKGSY